MQAQASELCADIDKEIESVEIKVREDVRDLGETVKGADLWAVFNKGRVSWDTAGLDGYAKARPEVLEFKKMGAPYITIRKAAE